VTIPDHALLQAAAVAPAVAGVAWLALHRWPWIRRAVGGVVWLAAHAAAWAVFWRLYGGETLRWRSLEPGLLQASIVPIAEIGVLLALIRAEGLGRRATIGAVVGLTVSTSAVVFGAYAVSLIAQAVFLPVPTLAAAVVTLAGSERRSFAGLGGLAAADLVGVVGLTVLFDRSGSSAVASSDGIGLGSALLFLSAAAKAGALPGLATWRLTASEGPGALVTAALRGQAVAICALAGPVLGGVDESVPLAAAAAVVTFLAGAAGVLATRSHASLAAVVGACSAVQFLALGLGGSVGLRAFLLLFPAFLLASGVILLVGWPGQEEVVAGRSSRAWRWVGGAALTVSLASLAGLPPSGGFPGTWLTLDLATVRGVIEPLYIVFAGAATLGLVAAAVGAISLVRAARPQWVHALLGAAGAGLLLYIGSLPVRVGGGWLVRVEEGLNAPRLLSFAGAPSLPPIAGDILLMAAAAAAIPVALVVLLGRGVRDAAGSFAGLVPRGKAGARARGPAPWVRKLRAGGERLNIGMAAAMLIEGAAVWSIAQLVISAGRRGFL
jgi:hypothetical protein